MATKKKKTPKKAKTVTLGASIKRGAVSDEFSPKLIPADLKKALADLKAQRIDEEAACKVVTKYLAANFIGSNLDDETLFDEPDDVWAFEVEAYALWLAGDALPRVTAAANFKVKPGKSLPKTADEMQDWEDDNTPLTDAVNFFWRFGDTELLIGEHEGAGAGIEELADD